MSGCASPPPNEANLGGGDGLGGSGPSGAAEGAGASGSPAGAAGSSTAGGAAGAPSLGGVAGGGVLNGDGLFEGTALAAVSLSYDDGLDSQLAVAQPALEAVGLRGTFFLSSFEGVDHDWALPNASASLNARHLAWQAAAAKGHELAGHTVNHPCNDPNKTAGFRLTDYDSARMAAELTDNLTRLLRLGAVSPFTFAYPCASDRAGLGPSGHNFSALVDERFFAARVSADGMADPRVVVLGQVPQLDAGGKTGDQLRALVDQAVAARAWLVLLFHGVGEEATCSGLAYAPETCTINYLTTSTAAHASLASYLAEQKSQVWTAPFKTVATRIAAKRP